MLYPVKSGDTVKESLLSLILKLQIQEWNMIKILKNISWSSIKAFL